MSFFYKDNGEIDERLDNLVIRENCNIEGVLICTLPPVLPDVIFDTTDALLSTDLIMISNGTNEIKQSAVDINNPLFTTVQALTNIKTNQLISNPLQDLTINCYPNKNIIIDTLGVGVVSVLSNITMLNTADLRTNSIFSTSAGEDLTINADTNGDIYLNAASTGDTNIKNTLFVDTISSSAGNDLTITSNNKDIILDSVNGTIFVNTVSSKQLQIACDATKTDNVVFTSNGNLAKDILCLGVHNTSLAGEVSTFIASQIAGVMWTPLRIGTNQAPTVIGSAIALNQFTQQNSTYNGYLLTIEGNTNMRTGGLYVAGTQILDNSRNLTNINSLVITGNTYPKEIGGFINLSVAHPSGLGGIRIVVPSYVTNLKEIRTVCTLSGSDSTANLEVRDAFGTLLTTMSTSTNSTQLLTSVGTFSIVGSNWLELTTSWTGGTVGTFTIASHTMAFL